MDFKKYIFYGGAAEASASLLAEFKNIIGGRLLGGRILDGSKTDQKRKVRRIKKSHKSPVDSDDNDSPKKPSSNLQKTSKNDQLYEEWITRHKFSKIPGIAL